MVHTIKAAVAVNTPILPLAMSLVRRGDSKKTILAKTELDYHRQILGSEWPERCGKYRFG